ncbi:MAG: ABC transporter ATP-binding protein [Mycoplasmataceae bacterium]|nr:ABC transporter ATP-binding protein [Mycoplasmataceae bacterium]
MKNQKLLSIKNLHVKFSKEGKLLHVIRGVNLDIYANETVAIIGESGCGKTVFSKTIGGILEEGGVITDGEIVNDKNENLADLYNSATASHVKRKILNGLKKQLKTSSEEEKKNLQSDIDYLTKSFKAYKTRLANKLLHKVRGKEFSYIFQDPARALNPLLTIGSQIVETILLHSKVSYREAKERALELLTKVGIADPQAAFKALPSNYSGGMRQRIVIAIAISTNPKVLIADEPTTALDVTIQKQILDLLAELKKELNLTVVFISHDLSVIANIADRIFVMYAGKFVEYGEKKEIFFEPKHPYTWALLSSMPQFSSRDEKLFSLSGTPPQLERKIVGDPFAPRNEYALEIDYLYEPPLFEISPTHYVASWLYDERNKQKVFPEQLKKIIETLKTVIK